MSKQITLLRINVSVQVENFSYVFWMGDLNFRLVEEYEKSPEEIDRAVKKGELVELFQFDQLRYVMRRGEAFSELTENDPGFPPTFKYEVGTSKYDYKCVIYF